MSLWNELKEYVVADEIINGELSHYYTIRVKTDVSPNRFKIVASFNSYEEAHNFVKGLRLLKQYRSVV